MKIVSRTMLAACAAIALICPSGLLPAFGQEPDNSGRNKAQSQTADDQTNARSDRLLSANVRKAIVGDKNLSTYAHNVKIIAHGGHVTLKGPVKSADEQMQILADVASAVSAENISNELTVKE